MNALILSAVFGVIMLFSGLWLKQKAAVRGVAIFGMVILLIVNIWEMYHPSFFPVNTSGMMAFDRFALLFNTIACSCTLVFFLLSGKDMEKVGSDYSQHGENLFPSDFTSLKEEIA